MVIIKYSELLDDVLPNLAADPSDPVTEYAIKRACIEFCAGSWIWKELSDPIDVTAGEAFYDLEPSNGADITAVMDVAYNGTPLPAKSVAWLDANLPGWRSNTATPQYFTQVDTEQIILAPVPAAALAAGLTLTLAMEPSRSSTGLPKWIFNQYMYTLADGAMARLMLMPDKPWTNLANGQDRRQQFEAGIASARASAVAGLGRATLRVASQH